MNSPLYSIEVWPHGWTISGPGARVPIRALNDSLPLFKKAEMDFGLARSLRVNGHPDTVFAVGNPSKLAKWRKEIADGNAHLYPEAQWWLGSDVGLASSAIFAVFSTVHRMAARDYSGGAVPRDSDDFGRCTRLLALFPGWRARLSEVATAYPETKWPALVARWSHLEAAPDDITRDQLIDSLTA